MARTRKIRIEHKREFVLISNQTARDERLAADELGVLVWLLSHADGYRVGISDIMRRFHIGRDRARRILRSLAQAGYLRRERVQGDGGRFEWDMVVSERPIPQPEATIDGLPVDGSPVDGPPTDGQPVDLKSNNLKKQSPKNKREKEPAADAAGGEAPPHPASASKKKPKQPRPKAADIFRSLAGFFPPRATWDDLARVDDLARWGRVVKAWIAAGWNPRNIAGMLDYYRRGETPGMNGARRGGEKSTIARGFTGSGVQHRAESYTPEWMKEFMPDDFLEERHA